MVGLKNYFTILSRLIIPDPKSQFEILNNDLLHALDNLGKSAHPLRRLFINGLTADRLERADLIINKINATISELIRERLGLSGISYNQRIMETRSNNGSISSIRSYVSTASSISSQKLSEVKKEKNIEVSKDSIKNFISNNRFEIINQVENFDRIDSLMDYAARVLRSADLYFASSARCNNIAEKNRYQEYILQLGDIIIVLNCRGLELAKKMDFDIQNNLFYDEDDIQGVNLEENYLSEAEENARAKIVSLEVLAYTEIVDNLHREAKIILQIMFRNKLAIQCMLQEEINNRDVIEASQANDLYNEQTKFNVEKNKLIIKETAIKETKARLLKELEQNKLRLNNEEGVFRDDLYWLESKFRSGIADSLIMLKIFEQDRLKLNSYEKDDRDEIAKQEVAFHFDMRNDFHRKKLDVHILKKTREETKVRTDLEKMQTSDRDKLLLIFNTEKNKLTIAEIAKKAEMQQVLVASEAARKAEIQQYKMFGF